MPSVTGSISVAAPADVAWAMIGEFNGLPDWLPFIASSEIEGGGPPNEVGAVRRLGLAEGGEVRESLLERSDAERLLRYDIVETDLPVRDYVGTARVIPDGDDRSTIEWTSSWENDPEVEQEMIELFRDTFLPAGLAAAKAKLAG